MKWRVRELAAWETHRLRQEVSADGRTDLPTMHHELAVMSEILRRLLATNAVLLWANARDSALPFYQRFGFEAVPESGVTGPETGRPHHIIVLALL